MKKYFLVSKMPRKSRFDFRSCFDASTFGSIGDDGCEKCLRDRFEFCIELSG